jgi:hypothetical protein
VGIKSMVAGYFGLVNNQKASNNCQYKNITVCKGSCYVVKQIKIFSSEAPAKKTSVPQIDLDTFKEVISDQSEIFSVVKLPEGNSIPYTEEDFLYSFDFSINLIKPPSA